MRVFEEREKKHLNSARKKSELFIVEPPRSLFNVVVNNYRQQYKQDEEIVETMINDQQSLPPQPSGYIKFPKYDWF